MRMCLNVLLGKQAPAPMLHACLIAAEQVSASSRLDKIRTLDNSYVGRTTWLREMEMPVDAAITFDRLKDYSAFFAAEPIGAVKWLASAVTSAAAGGPFAQLLTHLRSTIPDLATIASHAAEIEKVGKALTAPFSQFSIDEVRKLGLIVSDTLAAPMLRGTVRVVPTTRELGVRLVLSVGAREYPLVCSDDALECFAADLSAFAGAYDVAVVGWPDNAGQIFVEEAAPIMQLPKLTWGDWAQGRLFDNGVAGSPVVLRVNGKRQITIADTRMQERLRPFIGTGVVLYGRRVVGENGSVVLDDVHPELWFLTRLTNPADPAQGYPGAPRPALVEGRALCIGATPPWNWQGPNVETHIVAPQPAASLSSTEERRVVFGKPATSLPDGWPNPVGHVTRVIEASAYADAPIAALAHIATRRAPRGSTITGLRGLVELVSAELAYTAP
jgi:hypothetical protein